MRIPRTFVIGSLALVAVVLLATSAWALRPRAPRGAGGSSSASSTPLASWTVTLPAGALLRQGYGGQVRLPSVSSVPDAGLPATIFLAQAGDASGFLQMLDMLLPPDRKLAWEAELRRFCGAALGNGVSCIEEVLPAFQGPLTLTVASGDPPRWMLHGETADSAAFRILLPLLHASARERIASVTRVTRQLSSAHAFDNLRLDPSGIREETGERGGWRVQETTDRDGRGFLSAVRGKRFILGSERETVLAVLERPPQPLPSSLSAVVAQGAIRGSDVTAGWLSTLLPPSAIAALTANKSGTLLWQAEQRGNQLTITVR